MQVDIDRKSGIPIYLQLKKHIEYLVNVGFWELGKQLPTERALAEQLGISRNTVSVAYRELEAEGILSSLQGKGTFVASADATKRQHTREERLLRIIDAALSDALEIGCSFEEFASSVAKRSSEKKELLSHLDLTLVECNREQVDYFAKELELGSGVHITPLLIEDFEHVPPAVMSLLNTADVVVTTFFHLDQLKALVPDRADEIIGIALDPDITVMVRAARLPREALGLVCISNQFAERVQRSLALAGLEFPEVVVTTSRSREEVLKVLQRVSAVLVSPGRRKQVEQLLPRPMEVIEVIYHPDEGSINALRSVLVEKEEARLS